MNVQDNYDWMVCARCFTYNHAPYIEDAMNGFCMQKTSFPYVCVIVDDASIDGEQEIIKNYLDNHFELEDKNIVLHDETDDYILTFARHKTNLYCFFAVIFLKYNHYSIKKSKVPYFAQWYDKAKYVAMCEGDDYWIDPYKVQEEVNILERNEQIKLVHTAFGIVNDKNEIIGAPEALYESILEMQKDGYLWQNHLVLGTPILFCTTMYRQGILDQEGPTIDYAQFMSCARRGKIAYIDKKMANYRILSTSMMRSARENVISRIKDGIFWQLYFFSRWQYDTDDYYKRNFRTRVLVSEAIISSLLIWNKLTVPQKSKKLFYILFSRPLNTLLLPIALITKSLRRLL